MEAVLKQVLGKIRPSKLEEKNVSDFVTKLISVAEDITGLDVSLVGSIGKNTWLSGDHDIDMFIVFPKKVSREFIEKEGLEFGKAITKKMKGECRIKYAEHPYTNAKIKFRNVVYTVDIVPCYGMKEGEHIQSAVDRSPLHLAYVCKNLKSNDDVRLLKQFCKGTGVYGSDVRHQGFSGYICELLVIKYGTFAGVIKAASEWDVPVYIDFGEKQARFSEPLVIIDPVDRDRNASANVSLENLIQFIESAKAFLEKPCRKFFFPSEKSMLTAKEMEKLKNRETKFVAVTMSKPDVIDDVLYPQLRRSLKRIERMMIYEGFHILRNYAFIDESDKEMAMIFEFEIWSLPHVKRLYGPPLFSKRHAKEFIEKYKSDRNVYGPYLYNDRLAVERDRTNKSALHIFNALLNKKPDELLSEGIAKHVAFQLKKAKILEHTEFWKMVEKNSEFSKFMKEKYFSKTFV